jgi:hypothetical protein
MKKIKKIKHIQLIIKSNLIYSYFFGTFINCWYLIIIII